MENKSIAIVGMAYKLPGMESWEEASAKLRAAESCINELSEHRRKDVFGRFGAFPIKASGYLDQVDLFDNKYFGLTEKEAINMSPEERMMMMYSLKAFAHAGYSPNNIKGSKTGVFYASSNTLYDAFFDEARGIGDQTPGIEGTRVANFFDLRGPVIDFNTTCSSSLTALHYACNSLLIQECEMALVGGVKISVNEKTSMNNQVITSRQDACKPFDKDADGTLAGEGTVCLIVKRLEDALNSNDFVYGVIESSAINHGGSRTSSLVAPSSEAQKEVIVDAWKKGKVEPSEIRFIEAHGTGTILGDPIEYKGIVDAFEEMNCTLGDCTISSIKGQIGHLDTMSGLAGMIRLLIGLNEKVILPQAGFSELNAHINGDSRVNVSSVLKQWESKNGKRTGGISSFGLTGTNVHMVVSQSEKVDDTVNDVPQFFQLSASSLDKLEQIQSDLKTYINSGSEKSILSLSNHINSVFSLNQVNRGFQASSIDELIVQLSHSHEPSKMDTCLVLNLTLLQYSNQDLEEAFAENRLLEDYWSECTGGLNHRDIENNLLRNTLFQFTICTYLRNVLKNNALFICRQNENTVHHLLEGKITANEIINEPSLIEVGSAPFNSEAFLDYVQKAIAEGKKITAIAFSDIPELTKSLIANGVEVIDGQFRRNERFRFYEQALRKGDNALVWKKKRVATKDGVLPFLNLKRFWPEITPIANHVINEEVLEAQKESTKAWDFDSIRQCIGEIWMDYLDLEAQPNLKDDFFKIGGSSLIGLDVLTEIEKEIGVVIGYQDLFDYAVFEDMISLVLKQLSQELEERESEVKTLDEEARSESYQNWVSNIRKINYDERWEFKKVLVTGATGFLGAFIVDKLLANGTAEVVCLVRGDNSTDAEQRFKDQYLRYFESLDSDRITVVCGDIIIKGLVAELSQNKPLEGVDAVYHSAGIVSHYGKYELSHQINVNGTQNVFDWATENGVKVFNHMSTLAVSEGKVPFIEEGNFYESDGDLGQEFNGLIYPKSKFLAEQYIKTQETEMQVNVFRLGNIGGRTKDGLFQSNIESNNVYLMLKSIALTGRYADMISEMSIEFEPVDKVVEAIFSASTLKSDLISTFHLYDYKRYFIPEIVQAMKKAGLEIKHVSNEELMRFYQELTEDGNLSEDYTSIGILRHTMLSDSPIEMTRFEIHNAATIACIESTGVPMEYDREEYLEQIIAHGIKCGFIPVNEINHINN